MKDEIWVDLKDFPKYQISNSGKIKNIRTKKVLKDCFVRDYTKHTLVNFEGKKKSVLVHRHMLINLVCKPPTPNHEAMHLDGNPRNNELGNLKWGLHSENMAMNKGNNHSHKGENNKNKKLND